MNAATIVFLLIFYMTGLPPAFDFGSRRYGHAVWLFAWFWPLFVIWAAVARSYGGDWDEQLRPDRTMDRDAGQ